MWSVTHLIDRNVWWNCSAKVRFPIKTKLRATLTLNGFLRRIINYEGHWWKSSILFHCHAYTNLTQPHTLLSTCDICCLFINKRKRLSNIKLRYINIRYINIENHWCLFRISSNRVFHGLARSFFHLLKLFLIFYGKRSSLTVIWHLNWPAQEIVLAK